ncbi:hypothetical protein [Bradyrhizobium genosp. P]|uniref:hypothetical protein n=1 Tax=Bradyrhizobium genosp. P TaxID=83641 RepID=UPI003CF3618D
MLLVAHIGICCISLIALATTAASNPFDPAVFHILFLPQRLVVAVTVVAAFALIAIWFVYAPATIGYYIGIYLYSMVLSYLWLNCFSDLDYNHILSGSSAFLSCMLFLLPVLFVARPFSIDVRLSLAAFDRLLVLLLCSAAIVIFAGASYSFSFVSIDEMAAARESLATPKVLNYFLAITMSAVLPFTFAGLVARQNYWLAAVAITLQFFLYPITLSKLALFAPFWLIALLLLTKAFEFRLASILSLLLPMLLALLAALMIGRKAELPFSVVNFRMIAVPAVGLDIYNDFFSRHELTHFCQVSIAKASLGCTYDVQLSIIMHQYYHLGNFNASLFATEGIASVGPWLAPLVGFGCGFVVAIGNRVSVDLSPRFVLLSGAVLPQILLNVPLTVALVTGGMGLLYLLWLVTPRALHFSQDSSSSDAPLKEVPTQQIK